MLHEPLETGELTINLRAEGDPETLREVVAGALHRAAEKIPGLAAKINHAESFRPGKPSPTYRMALA